MTLCLEQVAKRYGRRGRWILDGVDLKLPPGTASVVSGANGSGKSTLLRIVVGVTAPSRGAVRNRPARVAFAPDRFAPPRMSARTYLDHLGRLRGLAPGERRRRSSELLSQLAIVPGPDIAMDGLSRGNAKKVALAQAFIAPVDLIVLDEPRAALDEPAQAALEALITGACERGTAVVIADHGDVPAGTRRCRLVGGKIDQVVGSEGRAEELVRVTLRRRSAEASLVPLRGLAVSEVPGPGPDDTVSLIVEVEHSDAFLSVALAHGWSPRELQALSPAEGGDRC